MTDRFEVLRLIDRLEPVEGATLGILACTVAPRRG
jgi:hypothetical protein